MTCGGKKRKKFRYNCEILTSLLREQVPVLDFVKWRVSFIEQGRAHTVLPLISSSTNQHCTHQAALLFLAADYTGGIALASLIPNWPVIGVHPVAPSREVHGPVAGQGRDQVLSPQRGLPGDRGPGRARAARAREEALRAGQDGPGNDYGPLPQRRGGSRRGEHDLLCPPVRQTAGRRRDPDKINVLYQHKLISSAELIAGVRARESGGLFEDPFAARVAGEHGVALAARFCEKSPQLGGMVAARTRHLDLQILEYVRSGGRDLVLLGAGYDMRPFRLNLPAAMRVYELDFPTVLTDRQRRLDDFGVKEPDDMTRFQVPIDLRMTPLAAALQGIVDFTSPIFIAWEGMSMYFEEAEVRAMLAGMAPLLRNNRSRLWLDLIDERAVVQPEIFPEVKAFMTGMQLLGEPFVFGVESAQAVHGEQRFPLSPERVVRCLPRRANGPGVLDLSFLHGIRGSRFAARGDGGRGVVLGRASGPFADSLGNQPRANGQRQGDPGLRTGLRENQFGLPLGAWRGRLFLALGKLLPNCHEPLFAGIEGVDDVRIEMPSAAFADDGRGLLVAEGRLVDPLRGQRSRRRRPRRRSGRKAECPRPPARPDSRCRRISRDGSGQCPAPCRGTSLRDARRPRRPGSGRRFPRAAS